MEMFAGPSLPNEEKPQSSSALHIRDEDNYPPSGRSARPGAADGYGAIFCPCTETLRMKGWSAMGASTTLN